MIYFGPLMVSATAKWVKAPATSRHTSRPPWLLPSGPDQVNEVLLREDQGLHRGLESDSQEREDYLLSPRLLQLNDE